MTGIGVRLRRQVRAARHLIGDRRAMGDAESARRFRRLRHYRTSPGGSLVELRPRALGGAPLLVRPGTSDAQVVWYSFVQQRHLPPSGLSAPSVILDLGANIGATMAHFASLYPTARVFGAELDPGNAALCRRNVASFGERCRVIEAAVWNVDGRIAYDVEAGREDGASVDPAGRRFARAISLRSLLDLVGGQADYVKINVEGAESALLSAEGWEGVRAVGVEVHEPFTTAACAEQLRRIGFAIDGSRGPWVYGRRPAAET